MLAKVAPRLTSDRIGNRQQYQSFEKPCHIGSLGRTHAAFQLGAGDNAGVRPAGLHPMPE